MQNGRPRGTWFLKTSTISPLWLRAVTNRHPAGLWVMGHNSPWPFCRLLKPFEPSLKFYNVTRIPVGVTAHVSSVSYLERAPIRLFAGWPVFRANTCFGLLPCQDSLELPRTDPTHLQSLDTLTRLSDNSLKVRNVFLPRSPDGPWWHLGKQLAATSHPGGPLLSTSLTPPPLYL